MVVNSLRPILWIFGEFEDDDVDDDDEKGEVIVVVMLLSVSVILFYSIPYCNIVAYILRITDVR